MSEKPEVDWWFIDVFITVRCPCGEAFEDSCDDTSQIVCPKCETRYHLKTQLVEYVRET